MAAYRVAFRAILALAGLFTVLPKLTSSTAFFTPKNWFDMLIAP